MVEYLARRVRIGACEAVCYPVREVVEVCSQGIIESPAITICHKRCLNAVKGGPIDSLEVQQHVQRKGNP
ncbi:MAG: hypothetical protein AB1331_05435 [Bacillota bacterium]